MAGPDWTYDSFNTAREKLLNDVAFFCGGEAQAVIVYDGTKNEYSDGHTDVVGQVKIVFSKTGKDADQTVIELAKSARDNYEEVTVVSSDAGIQNTVMGWGVARMSSREFCREFESLRMAETQEEEISTSHKSTIGSSITADVLKKLENMRDE